MKKEKISMVLGELADRHIEDALYCEQHAYSGGWRRWQKAVACVALIAFCIFGMTGIAFAANAEFRKMVVELVSSFSEEEKTQIRNGHGTTSVNRTDTLIEFLHNFNDNNMGNGVKVKYSESGFDYVVLEKNSKDINIIVTCESDQLKLLVNMRGEEIEGGIQAWKITSYQLVSFKEADELLNSFSKESQVATVDEDNDEIRDDPKDSVISASKQRGKIYNALHKEEENVITLTKEETIEFKSIFESYTNDEIGWEGQEYNYIILFDEVDYMITEDGFVIKEDKNTTSAFKMESQDLKKVMNLFERYKIKYQ